MKKIGYFCFLTFIILGLCSCVSKQKTIFNEYAEYKNEEVNISLKYPSQWKPDNSVTKLGSLPSRYFSDDGFFALNVISRNDLDLEEIANREVSSGDYGKNPTIERIIHKARIGYLILPSSDQSSNEKMRSCFITELRTVFRSNSVNFDVLFFFADKDHINSILDSLEVY